MIIEIIKHTPLWVFILFFILLTVGYFQSINRVLNRVKVFLLPIGMLAFSLYGTISVFGIISISLFSWLVGIVSIVLLGKKYINANSLVFFNEHKIYFIKGSWIPLILMMSIFFIKYTIGVALALKLPILNEPIFISGISLCYGIISGIFLARALVILDFMTTSNKNKEETL